VISVFHVVFRRTRRGAWIVYFDAGAGFRRLTPIEADTPAEASRLLADWLEAFSDGREGGE